MHHFYLIFTALLFAALSGLGQPQLVQDDFEGNGTITRWLGDECDFDPAQSNPLVDAANPSATVLAYRDTGGTYANVRFDVPANYDLSVHHTFSLKIYVPSDGLTGNQPNQVSLKLQDGNLDQPWVTQSEIIKPIALDQWQTVWFDFASDAYRNLDPNSPPPIQRSDFNRVVIQVNGENNNDLVRAYLDDVAYDGTIEVDTGSTASSRFDQLVWADEFDQEGSLDASKWFQQNQLPRSGSWFNGEIQHYTDREENAFVADGVLHLVAKRETFTDQGQTKPFTSARLNSKFAFTYGRVEVRAKLPSGVGTWPAIWMLGQNIDEAGAYWETQGLGTTAWPACGEIDIMEHWGVNQNYVQSATHTPSSFGATVNHGGRVLSTASTAFHVYALEWTPEKLVFSVDGDIHYTYEPEVRDADTWPFDAPQYLLMNIAILPDIAPGFTEGAMEVDYVRVYQEGTTQRAPAINGTAIRAFPNPVRAQLTVSWPQAEGQVISIELYDTLGKRLRTYHPVMQAGGAVLPGWEKLAPGTYLLRVGTGVHQQVLRVVKP